MFERFTDTSRLAVAIANQETHRLGGNIIGVIELLLGLVKANRGVANRALRQMGVDLAALAKELELHPRSLDDGSAPQKLPQTPAFKTVIESAIDLARELRHPYVGTEHMILGLLRDPQTAPAKILAGHGVTFDRAKDVVIGIISSNAQDDE